MIDIDSDPLDGRGRRRAPMAIVLAAAVLLLGAAAVTAGVARASEDRQVLVTVTAYPVDRAAARITAQGGHTLAPTWGQPTRLDATPRHVSVITWAADHGASCAVWIDGVVVVEQTVAAPGQPVSCVWP